MTDVCPLFWAGPDQLWRAAAGEAGGLTWWTRTPHSGPSGVKGPYIRRPRELEEGLRQWVKMEDGEEKLGR